ncbi:hypothetical protein MMC17_001806 [Xylographa soralifera]|nr:hypothetical protein [Xylographa soralifera]
MASASLDGIPVELRMCILLNVPDLETLRSLVHASPAYHQAYVSVKRQVLQGLVQRQLNLVSIGDAITAVRSFNVRAQTPCHTEMVIALLDRRRRAEETQHVTPTFASYDFISLEETIKLLSMQKVARFFLQDFCRNAPCPPWMDSTKWAAEFLPIQLSENETSRFLRAFYRLHIYCNLFGFRENHSEAWFPNRRSLTKPVISSTFEFDEIWDLFFATMPFWEVEEIACLEAYFRIQWTGIFKEVAPYFSRDGPRFGGKLGPGDSPFNCFELVPEDGDYEQCLGNIVCMGPSFLYKVLHQRTYEKRCGLIADNVTLEGFALMDLLDCIYIKDKDFIFPADKYDRDDIRVVLSSLSLLEQPNVAWIRHWYRDGTIDRIVPEGYYDAPFQSNCSDFQSSFGHPRGWPWAYVLWDLETLRFWQAPLLVEK